MNNFGLVAVGKIRGDFTIPSYQRGYRWGVGEVRALLDDIFSCLPSSDPKTGISYCLQPIVLLKREEGKYDLIDGQQRLTTLYILYKYLEQTMKRDNIARYTIRYATRPNSEVYLQKIDSYRSDENIDFWHMHQAYETIATWFEEKALELDEHKEDLAYKITGLLGTNINVIWYEITTNSDANTPEDLFTRLNIGKIPLTNSELVKALFLKESAEEERKKRCADGKQVVSAEQISILWDRMESTLSDDAFWYFLTTNKSFSTRIDLILDLMANRCHRDYGDYATFCYFENRLNGSDEKVSITELWTEIQDCFLRLKGWYDDHTLYHKIGYLIASSSATLRDVYKWSEGRRKKEFEEVLDNQISKSIDIGDRPYSELTYESANDRWMLSKVLLLFNVESVRTIGTIDTQGCEVEGEERFPFDKYNTYAWSLEHIHAQHSEGLNTNEKRLRWLEDHISPLRVAIRGSNAPRHAELIARANALIKRLRNSSSMAMGDEFNELHTQIVAHLSCKSIHSMHNIDNLTLLEVGSNSAVSNYVFDAKRNIIIRKDRLGYFIPFCTKMVFFKYYSSPEDLQLHYWGVSDREDYINAINEKLKPYLGGKQIEFYYPKED